MLLLNDRAHDALDTDAPPTPDVAPAAHSGIRLRGAEAMRAAERVLNAIDEQQLDLEMQLQVTVHSVATASDEVRNAIDLEGSVAEVSEVARALAILRADADDARMATLLAPGEPLVTYLLHAYAWATDALVALDAVARGGTAPSSATLASVDHEAAGRAVRFALTELTVDFDDPRDPLHSLRGHIERLLWTLAIARRDLDARLRAAG
jgi:hypothetical protein